MKIYGAIIGLWIVFLLAGCNPAPPAAGGPGDVLRQYVAASRKKDPAAMKALLSKGSLELLEKSAAAQKTTADELLRREAALKPENVEYRLETRDEKIEGDAATVEIKNELTGEFDMKMPFVKENGAWKLARDKFIEEEVKRTREEIDKKLANSAFSNTNSANR